MGSRRPDEAPIPTIGNAGVSSGLEEDSDRPSVFSSSRYPFLSEERASDSVYLR